MKERAEGFLLWRGLCPLHGERVGRWGGGKGGREEARDGVAFLIDAQRDS